ncbi:hypothetical protein ACFQHV_19345 [Promicromonospora thailandica]|uniref:hypothetical protein n=1 Tax=Promicromonospora thailandica TaxID=765201 RepID=UPI0020A59DF9|nr:hypothetical protein [Promicromonospora thailandica]BFF18291.1 hypothetical protein GCM10025730_18120 [Promicromonospora thailandica]
MYVALIDELLADEPSELERRVFDDMAVTDAELRESQDAYSECLERAAPGVEVEFSDTSNQKIMSGIEGFISSFPDDDSGTAALERVVDECSHGTTEMISMLYFDMRTNPEGLTPVEAVRACIEAKDLVEWFDLTDDELVGLMGDETRWSSDPGLSECINDPYSVE